MEKAKRIRVWSEEEKQTAAGAAKEKEMEKMEKAKNSCKYLSADAACPREGKIGEGRKPCALAGKCADALRRLRATSPQSYLDFLDYLDALRRAEIAAEFKEEKASAALRKVRCGRRAPAQCREI